VWGPEGAEGDIYGGQVVGGLGRLIG